MSPAKAPAPCVVHVWVEHEDHGARSSRLEDWTCERWKKLKTVPVEPVQPPDACPVAMVFAVKTEAAFCFQECAGKRHRVECPKRDPADGVP